MKTPAGKLPRAIFRLLPILATFLAAQVGVGAAPALAAEAAPAAAPVVAIVDSGISPEVAASVQASAIGDDGADECGHGTEMARAVLAENPAAEIVSVKAFSEEGRANLLAVYAGTLKALSFCPDIVVMSFTTRAPAGDPVMEALIAKARAQGATVVAAAGNQGADAADFSPANSGSAVAVGALGEDGRPLEASNWGAEVDAWETAPSTSYAAAIHAGKLSATAPAPAAESATPGPFTIAFDGNGGTGHMFALAAGGELELPECGFTKAGKELSGWNTRPDGKGRFVPDRQALDGTSMTYDYHGLRVEADLADCIEGGVVTLYAQWERPSVLPESFYDVQWGWWWEIPGTYLFKSYANNLYMTRKGTANNKNVYTAKYDSADNRKFQQWRIITAEDDGKMKFVCANDTSYALDLTNGNTNDHANVEVFKWNNSGAQKWWVDGNGNTNDSNYLSNDKLTIISVLNQDQGGSAMLDVDTSNNNVQVMYQLHNNGDPSNWYTHPWRDGFNWHGSKIVNRRWKPILATYTVKYNGNGSTSGTMASSSFIIDASHDLTANAFKKTGYYFAGWNTKADGTGTAYADKKSVTNLSTRHGATVNLYAQWKPYKVTAQYHANGGAIADAPHLNGSTFYKLVKSIVNKSASKAKDYAALTAAASAADAFKNLHNVVSTAGISKTGYHVESTEKYFYIEKSDGAKVFFNAENTAAGQTNPVTTKRLNLGKEITANKTVTLKVNWVANTYSIAYDGNGADGGSTPSTACTYNVAASLAANGYTRANYEFAGWNTKPDGTGAAYKPGQAVKNLSTADNATVTLYAQWRPLVTVELYVDDLTSPWKTFAPDDMTGTWNVPAALTDEARRADCHHADGTQGLEAWFEDASFTRKFAPRALEPGTLRLYARNWATVTRLHAGASDVASAFKAPDGTTGPIAVASATPPDLEVVVGTTVNLGEIGNDRLTYDSAGAFPLTIRARPGWYASPAGTKPLDSLAVTSDACVYKIWDASSQDGYVAQRG